MKSRHEQGHLSRYQGAGAQSFIAGFLQEHYHWSTSVPVPDNGVDLFVEVRHLDGDESFTIAVQCRSSRTSRKGTTLKAQTAEYLRTHDRPTFLFLRDKPSSVIFWVHLDPLVERSDKSPHTRPVRVRLNPQQRLEPDQPSPDLLQVIERATRLKATSRIPRLADLARINSQRWQRIDPRLLVTETFDGVRTGYVFSSSMAEPVSFDMKLRIADIAGAIALREAIEWGRPGCSTVNLSLHGSDLFEHLGLAESRIGQLTIKPTPEWTGSVMLQLEADPGVYIVGRCSISRGNRGVELLAHFAGGAAVFMLRFVPTFNVTGKIDIDFDKANALMQARAVVSPSLQAVLECIAAGGNIMLVPVDHPHLAQGMPFRGATADPQGLRYIGHIFAALGAITELCRTLDIVAPSGDLRNIVGNEVDEWLETLALLRLDHRDEPNRRITFDSVGPLPPNLVVGEESSFFTEADWECQAFGERLCLLKGRMHFDRYRVEEIQPRGDYVHVEMVPSDQSKTYWERLSNL